MGEQRILDLVSMVSAGALGHRRENRRDVPVILTRFPHGETAKGGTQHRISMEEWEAYRREQACLITSGKVHNPTEVGAILEEGARRAAQVTALTWLFFDNDGRVTSERMRKALDDLDITYLITESTNSAPDNPRWHLYLPFDRPFNLSAAELDETPAECLARNTAEHHLQYRIVCEWLCSLGGVEANDEKTNSLAQSCFVARCPNATSAERQIWTRAGRCIVWPRLLELLGYLSPIQRENARKAKQEKKGLGGSRVEVQEAGMGEEGPEKLDGAGRSRRRRTPGETVGSLCRIVAQYMGRMDPVPGHTDKWMVLCPWRDQHGLDCKQRDGILDSSTVIFLPNAGGEHARDEAERLEGGFCCKHNHSRGPLRGQTLTASDYIKWGRAHGAPLPDRELEEKEDLDEHGEPTKAQQEKWRLEEFNILTGVLGKLGQDYRDELLRKNYRSQPIQFQLYDINGEEAGILDQYQALGPDTGILCNEYALSTLRKPEKVPAEIAFCTNPADFILIDLFGWKEVEIAVFCGHPRALNRLAAHRVRWGADVVIVGKEIPLHALADALGRAHVSAVGNPSRVFLKKGCGKESVDIILSSVHAWTRMPAENCRPAPLARYYHVGDIANGRRFADAFGEVTRFCAESREWYVWTTDPKYPGGGVWALDMLRRTEGMAKAVVERMQSEEIAKLKEQQAQTSDEASRAALANKITALEAHARQSEVRKARMTMLQDAAAVDSLSGYGLAVPINRFDHMYEDVYNPERAGLIINCLNGVYDLGRNAFQPADRRDLCTQQAAVCYNKDATAPRWEACLQQWFTNPDSGQVDVELIRYVQAALGYACFGQVTDEGMWFHVGEGRNGKSTMTNLIKRLLGSYAILVSHTVLTGDDKTASAGMLDEMANMRGKRLILSSETDVRDVINSAMLKKLADRTIIRTKFMREKTFEFVPTGKLHLSTNHMPRILDLSDGMWRRVKVIPWRRQIPENELVYGLDSELWKEREGIFNWLIRGAQVWKYHEALHQRNEPELVRSTNKAYRQDQDWFGAFFSECCVLDPQGETATAELTVTFEIWYRDNYGAAAKPPSLQLVWRELSKKNLLAYSDGKQRGRRGMRLNENAHAVAKMRKQERDKGGGATLLRPTNEPPPDWNERRQKG